MNLMDHVEVCVEIGERASKEYDIELKLNDMKAHWEKKNF